MLAEVFGTPDTGAPAFICGPTSFVEAAADALVALGYEAGRVRTERFGPTGT
jgi:ferredoxin-NADP reductase